MNSKGTESSEHLFVPPLLLPSLVLYPLLTAAVVGAVANGGDTFRRLGSHIRDQDTPKYPACEDRAVVGIPTCSGMTGTADGNRGISTNSNSIGITLKGISRNRLGVDGGNRAGVENPVAKDGRMSSQGLVQRC